MTTSFAIAAILTLLGAAVSMVGVAMDPYNRRGSVEDAGMAIFTLGIVLGMLTGVVLIATEVWG